MKNFIYIILTIIFTVYGQLAMKWQVFLAGAMPEATYDKIMFVIHLLLNPWIISSLLSAFIASLCWMMALSKFDISFAYPFMSFAFVLTAVLSVVLFGESMNLYKIIGLTLIVLGIVVTSQA